jgi:hypothetical protein
MSGKNNGEDCNEDNECESNNCYNNTICVSEEGFRYLDSNDQLENARQNNVDDTKLATLEGAVNRSERGTGKKDIDEIGGREGIKKKIENKKQEKRQEQAPGGGRRVEVHHVKNDDGSREKVTIVREPENNEPIIESNSPLDIEKYKRLGIELAREEDENTRLNELLSKAPGDLTEKEVAELKELTSRLAKENGDLKSAAEKAAEKKIKEDARRREEDKVSPIDDEKDKQAKYNAMHKPDGAMRAPNDINRNELLRLNIKQKKNEDGRGDKKKPAESDTVRPADQVRQEKLVDGSRGECLLCQKPVLYNDNMNVCPTDSTNHIYHEECFQEMLLKGDNRCMNCRSIFKRDDIQLVERIVRIKTCPPADRHLIDESLHELIQTDDQPAKHVNPHRETEELYSDIFTDNDDVNRRKHEIHGAGYPITVTLQDPNDPNTLILCNETQQVSIKGCEIYNFDIPYRVRLDAYEELINLVRDGTLRYIIGQDGSDFLLFNGDTDVDRIDNRIDPRLYANQPASAFDTFYNNLKRQQQPQQNLPEYNNLPIPRQQELIADGLERIGRPDLEFRNPEMAQAFANVENIRNRFRQPQQGINPPRPPRVRVRRGRPQQNDNDFQDAVNALANMHIDDRQPYDPEDRARILERTTPPQYHPMELDPPRPPQRQVLDRRQLLPPLGYEPVSRDYMDAFIQSVRGVPSPENPFYFNDGRVLIGFHKERFSDLYRPHYQYNGGKRKTRRNRTRGRGRGRGRPYGSTRGSKKKKTIKKSKSHNTTKKNKKVNKKGGNVKISEQNNKI